MSSSYPIPFRRRLLRGISGPMAVTATRANASAAYAAMAASAWTEADGTASDLPPHKWSQSGFRDTYDAFKFCGDYDGTTARQKAYCGAVCYSAPLPAQAADGTSTYALESIAATCYGDRWLADGCRLDAFITTSADPPTWAAILAGTGRVATTGDPPAADAAAPALPRPFRRGARSNEGADDTAGATLAVSGDASTGSVRYLHLVLRLGDYATVPQITKNGALVDSAWIEGGAALRGDSLRATFSAAVEFPAWPESGAVEFYPKFYIPMCALPSHSAGGPTGFFFGRAWYADYYCTYRLVTPPGSVNGESALLARAPSLVVPGGLDTYVGMEVNSFVNATSADPACRDGIVAARWTTPQGEGSRYRTTYGFQCPNAMASGTKYALSMDIAYCGIQGHPEAGREFRRLRLAHHPLRPTLTDALVSAYAIVGPATVETPDSSYISGAEYTAPQKADGSDDGGMRLKTLVPAPECILDDGATLGVAESFSVCSDHFVTGFGEGGGFDWYDMRMRDLSPRFNNTLPKCGPCARIPWRRLFCARVPRGGTPDWFGFDAPLACPGTWGPLCPLTLCLFVHPLVGSGASVGLQNLDIGPIHLQ